MKNSTKKDNVHAGHRQRLKNRFLKSGLKDFEPHNMLELLLFYACPQKDTNETAHELLQRFGSLSGVFDADFSKLTEVNGIKEHSAILIKLISELARKYYDDMFMQNQKKSKNTLKDIKAYVARLFAGEKREKLMLICLDDCQNIIQTITLNTGTVDRTFIDIRYIAETALVSGCKNVVLAHNHPGGIANPSFEDLDVTGRVKKALSMCGVELCEHFVVAGAKCVGMYGWKASGCIMNADETQY